MLQPRETVRTGLEKKEERGERREERREKREERGEREKERGKRKEEGKRREYKALGMEQDRYFMHALTLSRLGH